MENLERFLKLSYVPRWVIVDRRKEQSVADHSFRVAAITVALLDEVHRVQHVDDDVRHRALWRAVSHDLDEAESGDIPTPYKAKMGPELSVKPPVFADEVVSVADTLEALIFIDRYIVRPVGLWQEHMKVLHTKTGRVLDHFGVDLTEAITKVLACGRDHV